MLSQLGRHGGLRPDASRRRGDLHVDAHHTVEDVGIVLGEALAEALGDKAGVRRFASIALPLDEALVEVALDLSGRPYLAYDVPLRGPTRRRSAHRRSTRSWPRSSGAPSSPPPAITLHVRLVTGQEHPPRPRGLVQGRGPVPARRGAGRGRGRALDQGHVGHRRRRCEAWTEVIAVLDYGIGNLALGREGARRTSAPTPGS